MDKKLALIALEKLDVLLSDAKESKVTLVIGGGGSMILQYDYAGATTDIDAAPVNSEFEHLKPYAEIVARELNIAPDWLNPYYQAFTVYLPEDASTRMQFTYKGKTLLVKSLGAEDILIMKLMAGRAKDFGHIKHLLKSKLDYKIVERRLEELKQLYPQLAVKALDRLDEFKDEHDE